MKKCLDGMAKAMTLLKPVLKQWGVIVFFTRSMPDSLKEKKLTNSQVMQMEAEDKCKL